MTGDDPPIGALTSTWVTGLSLGGLGKPAPEPAGDTAHPAAISPSAKAPAGSHRARRPGLLPAGRPRTAARFQQLMPLIVTRRDTATTPAQSRAGHDSAGQQAASDPHPTARRPCSRPTAHTGAPAGARRPPPRPRVIRRPARGSRRQDGRRGGRHRPPVHLPRGLPVRGGPHPVPPRRARRRVTARVAPPASPGAVPPAINRPPGDSVRHAMAISRH